MKNLMKITAAVLIVVIGIVAFNCSTSTKTDETATDSTAVVTPDSVVVTGGDSAVVK